MMRKMEEWRIVKKVSDRKNLGTVWLIEKMGTGSQQMERGYFKYATSKSQKYIGSLAATEIIANRLAKVLELPVAETKLVRVGSQLGVVLESTRSKQQKKAGLN